jgi:hypothetical protein
MNNVLDHNGYRFFQSSFDQMKTVLSVNHDFGDSHLTYAGYFYVVFSPWLAIMFTKDARFADLKEN